MSYLEDCDVTFWELLVRPARRLVEQGIPRDAVVPMRLAYTGHRRPLSIRWARTIGLWGRVARGWDIADVVDAHVLEVRSYSTMTGLRYATDAHQRAQWELAVMLYADRHNDPEASRLRHGVLPVERKLYLYRVQHLLDLHGMGFNDLLLFSPAALESAWRDARLWVMPLNSEEVLSLVA